MTFDKTIDVVVRIFVPVGAAVAGFFMPNVLGGGNAAFRMLSTLHNGTLTGRAAWGIQALINGAVGGAFWTLRKMDGLVAKAIGGAVGGFFLGGALGCLPGVMTAKPMSDGLIDKLASGLEGIAQEG